MSRLIAACVARIEVLSDCGYFCSFSVDYITRDEQTNEWTYIPSYIESATPLTLHCSRFLLFFLSFLSLQENE